MHFLAPEGVFERLHGRLTELLPGEQQRFQSINLTISRVFAVFQSLVQGALLLRSADRER